jgi:hypothetical protein
MQSLWQDLRYGMRGIRGNPGFSVLAILTLALGIGAGTTMFSVIKNVMLSPFRYKDATRIAAADCVRERGEHAAGAERRSARLRPGVCRHTGAGGGNSGRCDSERSAGKRFINW